MSPADMVTFSVPRSVLSEVIHLTSELTDRMHDLLERNADGLLTDVELAELAQLVQVAQFGQIVDAALKVSA